MQIIYKKKKRNLFIFKLLITVLITHYFGIELGGGVYCCNKPTPLIIN